MDELVGKSQQLDEQRRFEESMKLIQEKVRQAVDRKNEGQKVTIFDKKKKQREFKKPEEDVNMNEMTKKKFAPQPKCKMLWAMNLYDDWRRNRMGQGGVADEIIKSDLNMIGEFIKADLCFSLCRFVREVKKMDGTDYPPSTIREIVICLQMHLHENCEAWKLLDQDEFMPLRNVVDNTMKERHSMGLGVRKSCDVISLKQEEVLFNKGVLGESSPIQLLRTVIYMLGLHCALRGGVEHYNLRRPGRDSQISLDRDQFGRERIVYREDPLQKTNQGGLVCRNVNKVVYIYGASRQDRCPIYHYKKYINLLPESKSCKKMYLRCKKNPLPSVWYCDQLYGINKLKNCVKEICSEGGLEGKFSNHSLRATCASRMYESDIPEQIIKETIGHRSDCVRIYKRTSDHLREVASKTVSGSENCKRVKLDVDIKDEEEEESDTKVQNIDADGHALTVRKMIANVNKTRGNQK